MEHNLDNFVVHSMDFHMKQNTAVVNMESNIVAFVKLQGLYEYIV